MNVVNAWRFVVPVCGCHAGEEIEMQEKEGPLSMFYSCPKYYPQNRKGDEKACANRINLTEYMKVIEHLSGLIAEAAADGGQIDLTNYAWAKNGIQYKVLSHENEKIRISIINHKALR